MYMRAACASEYGFHMGSISFPSPEKSFPVDRAVYFTLDGFVSKTTGRNAPGKNREESRKIARRVRHAISRNENYIDVLVARNQNHVSSTKIWPKITGTAVRNLWRILSIPYIHPVDDDVTLMISLYKR